MTIFDLYRNHFRLHHYDYKSRRMFFEVVEPIHWKLHDGSMIIIPKGFVSDGATVPRWARWLVNPLGKHFFATVVHDWLYINKEGTRHRADREFLVIMIIEKVKDWESLIMYLSVRIGGRKWWKKKYPV